MASQMVIPASNDTLFIRGLSNRHHVDDIRDFFTREGGRNTVEFFKENNSQDGLFIALKFDSKSVAKDVLNRFDGYEVLGDRVNISWYKDIRKARSYETGSSGSYRQRQSSSQWSSDRYDYRGQGNYGSRNRSGQYSRGSGQRQSGGGWHTREYSGDGGGGGRTRRVTRSSSHSRSRSGTPRSRSRSYTRSSSRDDHESRSRSNDSRERHRRQRSTSDGSRRRKGKARDSSGSRSGELENLGSGSESESSSPPQKSFKKTKNAQKKDSETGKAKDNATGDFDESDINDLSEELSSAVVGKTTRAVRSAILTVDKPAAATKRQTGLKTTSVDEATVAANSSQADVSPQPNANKKQTAAGDAAGKTKKQKTDRRLYEDPISDDDILTEKTTSGGGHKAEERSKSPTNNTFDEAQTKRKVAAGSKKNTTKDISMFDDEEDVEENTKTRSADKSRRSAAAVTSGLSSSTKKAATASSRDGGVLGLSHEKMLLVRQKKDEIEKAYRQDCETFATVTKMLINKEPSLEDKIQNSLRDNLKEIGQRCIQELREFIDRLREEDEADSSI